MSTIDKPMGDLEPKPSNGHVTHITADDLEYDLQGEQLPKETQTQLKYATRLEREFATSNALAARLLVAQDELARADQRIKELEVESSRWMHACNLLRIHAEVILANADEFLSAGVRQNLEAITKDGNARQAMERHLWMAGLFERQNKRLAELETQLAEKNAAVVLDKERGLTLATLCDMLLGEDATDRTDTALIQAVGEMQRALAPFAHFAECLTELEDEAGFVVRYARTVKGNIVERELTVGDFRKAQDCAKQPDVDPILETQIAIDLGLMDA